jgi:hypothetical protein
MLLIYQMIKRRLTEIKSKSVHTQVNFIYYTELRVSTYLRSSSGSQFVFKTYWRRNIFLRQYGVKLKMKWNRSKHVVLHNKWNLFGFDGFPFEFCYKQQNVMTSFEIEMFSFLENCLVYCIVFTFRYSSLFFFFTKIGTHSYHSLYTCISAVYNLGGICTYHFFMVNCRRGRLYATKYGTLSDYCTMKRNIQLDMLYC